MLVATKQLLETLTQWSRHHATEGEVSDVYVRLGYEFNIACRAFNGIGVETSDLGPVPELLRTILEETLSQEASPSSLDKFLPRIRDIIINLLHGLKKKQQKLRARQPKEGQVNGGGLSASGSTGSLNTGLNHMLEDNPSKRNANRDSEKRDYSGRTLTEDYNSDNLVSDNDASTAYYPSSTPRESISIATSENSTRQPSRESQRPIQSSFSESSFSSATPQAGRTVTGQNQDIIQRIDYSAPDASERDAISHFQPPPPPPPPKQQDALAALQRGGDLERRASRRYSAYQISKHLGASTNGIPMLPPAQNSPIPNRGRDVRDSMNAVRTRGSGAYNRTKSAAHTAESSPVRHPPNSVTKQEEVSQIGGSPYDQSEALPSNIMQEPQLNRKQSDLSPIPRMGATITSPIDSLSAYDAPNITGASSIKSEASLLNEGRNIVGDATVVQNFVPEQSPPPEKDLTLFLQYKTRIKKFVLTGGVNDLSVPRLQLAFIEKFAWNTHNNGNDLPEIYIQDPVSGVRHELEDLRDVKDRSVLVLNVEALDEVKKHIDEGLGGIKRLVEGVRSAIDIQGLSLQRVSDRQQDTSKDLARLSMKASPTTTTSSISGQKPVSKLPQDQKGNIKALRQELAVVRQTFTTLVADMKSSMTTVREQASSIKTMAVEGVLPDLESNAGRSYVNTGKRSLGDESEKLVNQVDDLQDVVEELRKDVVTRGVRPLPRQLENVNKSISQAAGEVKRLQQYLRKEKPIWSKIWEKELEIVCTDRDFLTLQEELATDLEDDLDKATQTFALVEEATKQQNVQTTQGVSGVGSVNLRSTSKGLAAIAYAADQEIDPQKAKDGVLGEVRALRPNHETRLEAIERAEKLRQRELATRNEGEFTKEVTAFVEEGKLKKSGGVEETERLRKARDERNIREAWQKQQDRAAAKEAETLEAATADDRSDADDNAEHPQVDGESTNESDTVPPLPNIRQPGAADAPDYSDGEAGAPGKPAGLYYRTT